jgi:PAS domain S-box-containing protein
LKLCQRCSCQRGRDIVSREETALSAPRIVLVDRNAQAQSKFKTALAAIGATCEEVPSIEEAFALIDSEKIALVAVASSEPFERFGRELARLGDARQTPALLVLASDDNAFVRALDGDADDALAPDCTIAETQARVRRLLSSGSLRRRFSRVQRDAAVMVELTHALTSSLDFREILFLVVQRLAAVIRVERCSIVVARSGEGVGFVVVTSDDTHVRDLQIDLYRYPEIQHVLQTRRPLTIEDATSHPLLVEVRELLSGMRYPSLTIVPIAYEDRAMGVLFLRASERRGRLGESDLSVCQVVANATAIALRNAGLIHGLREERLAVTSAHEEVERRVRFLERYVDLFESSADAMVVFDRDGRVLFANPRAAELTGYTVDDLRDGGLLRVVASVDRGKALRLARGFGRGEFPRNVDLSICRRDGVERIVALATSPVLHDARAILVTFRDVTEERTTALELARTKEFLASLIESSPDAIIAARLDGTVLLFNPAAERILGYKRSDVEGSGSVEMLYPPGVARDIMRRVRASPERRLSGFRAEVLAASGERIPVLLAAALVMEDAAEVATVGVFSDMRERLRMEERLAQFQQRLALTEKQTIVAELAGAAAHELNQPLTAIQGYAELLQRRADADSPFARGASIILREAERMAEIVRKIGKITRYETKQYVGGTTILDLDRAAEGVETSSEEP